MSSATDIFRFISVALLLLLLGVFGYARRHFRHTETAAVFAACLIGYLLADWPYLRETNLWVHIMVLILPFSAPAAFWLFSKSLFDDGYRWRPRYGWLLLVVGGVHYAVYAANCYSVLPEVLRLVVGWLLHLLSLVFVGLGVFEALRNRDSDLVPWRIRFRTAYILMAASLMVLTLFSEISLRGNAPPPLLDFLQKFGIAGLAFFFALRLLVLRPGFFPDQDIKKPAFTPAPGADEPLLELLIERMDRQQYWRTEGLTIRRLAEDMAVKEYRLRQVINQHLGYRNFNDYLNGYRVRAACATLADPEQRGLTVLELAYALGYASLAPFNKAFREATGMTPTEWRRSKTG